MTAPKKRWLSRRKFLSLAGLTALVGVTGPASYAWAIEPFWVEVVRREMPIARLPETLVGRTLIHISDLHIGPVVRDDYITRAIVQACALNPDILVVTGDFMTCSGDEEVDHAARILEHLRPGRLATLAVLGNHDYGETFRQVRVADRLTGRLQALGIQVLRNQVHDVRGLQIAGIDDLWSPCFDLATLAQLDPARASLVLCHNPDGADEPGWSGYQGWILSGHTHGGQCRLPFCAPPILPVRNPRYTQGAIDLEDGRMLYINPGLGYLRRVRFNVRPEITVFTLTRGTINSPGCCETSS